MRPADDPTVPHQPTTGNRRNSSRPTATDQLHHYLKYPKSDCMFCGGEGILPPRRPLQPPILPPSRQHLQQRPVTTMSLALLLAGFHVHVRSLQVVLTIPARHSPEAVDSFRLRYSYMWFEATKVEHCSGKAKQNKNCVRKNR